MHVIEYKKDDSIGETSGFKHLEETFKKYHQTTKRKLLSNHPQVKKLLEEPIPIKEIETESLKLLAAGTVSAAMVLSPMIPVTFDTVVEAESEEEERQEEIDTEGELVTQDIDVETQKKVLALQIKQFLPNKVSKLEKQQSEQINRILKQYLGIDARSELDGISLNTDYGYTGYEQHLIRYPGDTVSLHDEHIRDGMAPKKGAWGYFANSKSELTDELKQKEKYYFAVQTFLAPGWRGNVYGMKDWFKYRKMIMVNTVTGDAVVGVVADAGPAPWTGKQFGASPEAMHALHLDGGMRKGAVVMMFVNDPDDVIPLGPVF